MADEDELLPERMSQFPAEFRLLLYSIANSKEKRESFEYLVSLPRAELQSMMKLKRDATATGRFIYWMAVVITGSFIGAAALGDSLLKIYHWFVRAPT